MELSERKIKILQAIIRTYLETGEPVGSRTISKDSDLNLSSATIRNEMADLEEMGYIIQPHTSAGRIPSDKGYRWYVDSLMVDKANEIIDIKQDLEEKAGKIDILLQYIAKLLAKDTNYTSMVSKPHYTHKKIKFVQLTDVDEHQILAVIVIEGNIVKNKLLNILESIDKEAILKMNIILNTFLQGLDITEINMQIIANMKAQAGEYATILSDVLDVIAEVIAEVDNVEIYTSGATNILKYPELSDSEKASEILYTFEEKKQLTQLIGDKLSEEESRGIQVYIGDETPVESMKDCAVVTATYEIEEGVYGKVGIVGPKRMDYEKVVGTLQNLMTQLDDIFKHKS
ncbi:heat-inducible transcription repressor HrcA [Clostridium sp. CAG:411]|nr:heat-inducible transcriptional repressor HrcA [Lachnospiraceae bacterium]CDE43131.1 heat-inducible transcription repressor HrcA [Clostridium sp. CAG:411]